MKISWVQIWRKWKSLVLIVVLPPKTLSQGKGFACSLRLCTLLLLNRHVIKNEDTASHNCLYFYVLTKKIGSNNSS
jgi:hypothetical protein